MTQRAEQDLAAAGVDPSLIHDALVGLEQRLSDEAAKRNDDVVARIERLTMFVVRGDSEAGVPALLTVVRGHEARLELLEREAMASVKRNTSNIEKLTGLVKTNQDTIGDFSRLIDRGKWALIGMAVANGGVIALLIRVFGVM